MLSQRKLIVTVHLHHATESTDLVWTREEDKGGKATKECYGLQINKEKEERKAQKILNGGHREGHGLMEIKSEYVPEKINRRKY